MLYVYVWLLILCTWRRRQGGHSQGPNQLVGTTEVTSNVLHTGSQIWKPSWGRDNMKSLNSVVWRRCWKDKRPPTHAASSVEATVTSGSIGHPPTASLFQSMTLWDEAWCTFSDAANKTHAAEAVLLRGRLPPSKCKRNADSWRPNLLA